MLRAVGITLLIGLASGLAMAASSPGEPLGNETVNYSYDALGRLSGSTITSGPNNGRVTGTCFDGAGNRMRYDVATSAPSTCPTPAATPTPSP